MGGVLHKVDCCLVMNIKYDRWVEKVKKDNESKMKEKDKKKKKGEGQ